MEYRKLYLPTISFEMEVKEGYENIQWLIRDIYYEHVVQPGVWEDDGGFAV